MVFTSREVFLSQWTLDIGKDNIHFTGLGLSIFFSGNSCHFKPSVELRVSFTLLNL